MKFSANLGFLWKDLSLPDAIRAAKAAGFDAVECHLPYDVDPSDVRAALAETGLPMLGLNTVHGAPGIPGLAAVPGGEAEARAAIDQALDYAQATGTEAVHVLAGFSSGPRAHEAFLSNLTYAAEKAGDRMILIEPLNPYDAPGYFLNATDQAVALIREVGAPNVKLMFDCYHVQSIEGDVTRRLARHLPLIGHIQVAAVPDRGAPDHGELDYGYVFREIAALGWTKPIGAEYRPAGATEDTLSWMG